MWKKGGQYALRKQLGNYKFLFVFIEVLILKSLSYLILLCFLLGEHS